MHIILAEGAVGVKIEADNNDITEHPHYDEPSMFGFSDNLLSAVLFFCLFQTSLPVIGCDCDCADYMFCV